MASRRALTQGDIVELTWFFQCSEAEIADVQGSLGAMASSDGGGGGGGPPGGLASTGSTRYIPTGAQVFATTRARKTRVVLDCMIPEHVQTLSEVYGRAARDARILFEEFGDLALVAKRTRTAQKRAGIEAFAVERERQMQIAYENARRVSKASPSFAAGLVLRADALLDEGFRVPTAVLEHHILKVIDRAIGTPPPAKRKAKGRPQPSRIGKKIDPAFLSAIRTEAWAMAAAAEDDWRTAKNLVRGEKKKKARVDDAAFEAHIAGSNRVLAHPDGRVLSVGGP